MTSQNDSKPSSAPLVITPSHFFKYTTQPLWVWYDKFGDQSKKEEILEFTLKLMEEGVLHEDKYVAGLNVSEVKDINLEEAIKATIDLMKQGAELIYQGCLQIEHEGVIYRGRPDLLEKREGKSIFGDWYYAPVEIKWSSKIKTIHKRQLAFYSIVLEKLQGSFSEEVAVINRKCDRLPLVLKDKDISKTQDLIKEIVDVMKGEKPAITITNESKNSPWFKVALEEAEEKQDIALIYKLDSRGLKVLRQEGVKTLQDMITINLEKLPKIPYASLETLQRAQLQAKSLLEKQIISIGKLDKLPDTALNIYFDIEGDTLLGIDYLFGIWVSGDEKHLYAKAQNIRFFEDEKYFVYFLAKQPEEEKTMWQAFLKWVALLPEEYTVYHYANYEKIHLEALVDEYGGSSALEQFQAKLFDLQTVVEKAIIFPLYFYSIKDIAKSSFLDFKWRHQKAGGSQSILWYKQWLETSKEGILADIINYNEDDVRATESLNIRLQKIKAAQVAIQVIKKTKELIFYSIQLTDAVQKEKILPEHFEKELPVLEPYSDNHFYIELDWTKYPEIFKQTADDIQVNATSHAIIICKESYSETLWVKEEENPDLYAAQMVLKLVRDAMGHMKAGSEIFAAAYWDINKNNRRIFEIKSLGIALDFTNLHDTQFKPSHLGGFSNVLRILDFLLEDLKKRFLC